MKKWRVRRDQLRQYIPYSALKKKLYKQICALEETILFDKQYYTHQASKAGIRVDPRRAVWHYVTLGDKLRLKPHPLFDTHYYHDIYRDVGYAGVSALHHFIEHGARENRNPHPAFDSAFVRSQTHSHENPLISYITSEKGTLNPHKLFDEKYVIDQLAGECPDDKTVLEAYFNADLAVEPSEQFNAIEYCDRYPDVRGSHPFYHYVRWGGGEGRLITGKSLSIENIKEEVEHIGMLDPDVIAPWQKLDEIGRVNRLKSESPEEQMLLMLTNSVDLLKPTFVHFTDAMTAGGAEKVLVNISNSFSDNEEVQQVVIIITGHGDRIAEQWLDGKKFVIIDLSNFVDLISDHSAALVAAVFLRMLKLKGVFVVNSQLGWGLIERHGKVLREFCNLSVACFCYDYDEYGRRAGFARTHLPRAIDFVDKIITDNHAFKSVLISDLRMEDKDAAKIVVLYQPIDIPREGRETNQRWKRTPRNVLWAGRFSQQKRLGLAIEIARNMPDLHFTFAGGDESDVRLSIDVFPKNVTLFGKFSGFYSLPFESFDLFLYTAEWDGLPNVLLEAAAVELPIVAPDVGGISELINDKTGWLVSKHSCVTAYVDKIVELCSDLQLARTRTETLRRLVSARHSRQKFSAEVASKILKEFVE